MISFLQPLALFALTAAAIPTLLHLLGRRLPPTVVFPAVRYLTATEREHSRHLRFRNLLLLILRTAALVFIALAVARPVADIVAGESHPPTALALVVDNSASSGAVLEGRRALDQIVQAAREVLTRVDAGDRLWMVFADGVPRRMSKLEAMDALDRLPVSSARLDLGAAVRSAADVIERDPLNDGPVVIVSDLQRSALSPGPSPAVRVIAWRPGSVPSNRWVESVRSEPESWTPNGGVVASIGGSADRQAALRLVVAGVELARTAASPGDRVVLSGSLPRDGWASAVVELDPDEFRGDDRRMLALRRAPPAGVDAQPGVGDFVREALSVLRSGGRVREGTTVALGELSQAGVSIVFPPSDPAMIGALNRALDANGVSLRYDALLVGEWQLADESALIDGVESYRRYSLTGNGNVYATAGGEPWLMRSGGVILVASRLEPEWTRLPITAAFVPWLDMVINRIAASEAWVIQANPGDVVELPAAANILLGESGTQLTTATSGQGVVVPSEPGVYFLVGSAGDTVGAVEVNVDPRESLLEASDEADLSATFGAEVGIFSAERLRGEVFLGEARMDLTSLMLVAAILAVIGEFVVSSSGGQARKRR